MKELWFSFGALSDKLSEQYKRQGYELKNAEKWDELVHSTVMLHIHGILTVDSLVVNESLVKALMNESGRNPRMIANFREKAIDLMEL